MNSNIISWSSWPAPTQEDACCLFPFHHASWRMHIFRGVAHAYGDFPQTSRINMCVYVYTHIFIRLFCGHSTCIWWFPAKEPYKYVCVRVCVRVCMCARVFVRVCRRVCMSDSTCITCITCITWIAVWREATCILCWWRLGRTHVAFCQSTCMMWLTHMCDMTHSHLRLDTFIGVTWLIHMCDMTPSYVWQVAFTCVAWRIHMCDMSHFYVRHDSFLCETWCIHTSGMTHSYVWHDSFLYVRWLIRMCDMTPSYVWHDWITCVTWLIPMFDIPLATAASAGVILHIYMSHVTYMNESRHT